MTQNTTAEGLTANPEALTRLFTHLLDDGLPGPEHQHLWDAAEDVWDSHPELQLSQNGLIGRFRRASVGYYIGSTAGLSIRVDVETAEGSENIQLGLKANKPSFAISAVQSARLGLSVEPVVSDYAYRPITESFDWAGIIDSAKRVGDISSDPLYLVAFWSKLKPDADTATLLEHDKRAHEAALELPDLIHYFGGTPDEAGVALSFCLWKDPQSARAISKEARHVAATAMVTSYAEYSVKFYNIHHTDGNVQLEEQVRGQQSRSGAIA